MERNTKFLRRVHKKYRSLLTIPQNFMTPTINAIPRLSDSPHQTHQPGPNFKMTWKSDAELNKFNKMGKIGSYVTAISQKPIRALTAFFDGNIIENIKEIDHSIKHDWKQILPSLKQLILELKHFFHKSKFDIPRAIKDLQLERHDFMINLAKNLGIPDSKYNQFVKTIETAIIKEFTEEEDANIQRLFKGIAEEFLKTNAATPSLNLIAFTFLYQLQIAMVLACIIAKYFNTTLNVKTQPVSKFITLKHYIDTLIPNQSTHIESTSTNTQQISLKSSLATPTGTILAAIIYNTFAMPDLLPLNF